jgi:hypothetical protein
MNDKQKKKAKLKWARKEIGRRLKGQKLSSSEKGDVMKEVWAEAADKFD